MRRAIRPVSSWRCSAPSCCCSCTTSQSTAACWRPLSPPSPRSSLLGPQWELEYHKLGGVYRREAKRQRRGGRIALHEERLTGRRAQERALHEERLQECFRRGLYLVPQRWAVR